jgi:hypothetical protein
MQDLADNSHLHQILQLLLRTLLSLKDVLLLSILTRKGASRKCIVLDVWV